MSICQMSSLFVSSEKKHCYVKWTGWVCECMYMFMCRQSSYFIPYVLFSITFFRLAILSKYLTISPKCILAEQRKSYVSNEAFSSHSDRSPVNPTVRNASSNVIFQWCWIFHQSQHHLPRKIKPAKNRGNITFLCIPQCCAQIKYCSVMERAWSLSLTDLAPAIFWLHDFDLV